MCHGAALLTVVMAVAITNLNPGTGIEELFNQNPVPSLMSKGPSSVRSTLPMTQTPVPSSSFSGITTTTPSADFVQSL